MPRDRDESPAVRVYTVCDESRYLIVRNVPALGCGEELAKLFQSYGEIEECQPMDAEDAENFTDVFFIKFLSIINARFAKRKLDEFVFYGNKLQVSYAPQFESLSDTKEKLEGRRKEILYRLRRRPEEQKPQTSSWIHRDKLTTSSQILSSSSSSSLPVDANLNTSDHIKSQNVHAEHGITKQHVSSNEDYFSSPSMNKTVTLVREKLDKIVQKSVLTDFGQPSKKLGSDKRKRI